MVGAGFHLNSHRLKCNKYVTLRWWTGVMQVQPGITKTLLSQWQTKNSDQFQVESRPVVVAEAEGCVVENEPTAQRPDVVRGTDEVDPDVELPSRGQAQLLCQQWSSMAESSNVSRPRDAKAIVLAEMAAAAEKPSVLENEPSERRADVVHGTDEVDPDVELPSRGQARLLRQQWSSMTESSNTSRPKDAKAIVLAEVAAASECPSVLENEPSERRADIVHGADEVDPDVELPSRGQARLLRQQWSSMTESSSVSRPKNAKAIVLAEVAAAAERPSVLENEPTERRADVVSGDDGVDEVIAMKKGFARDLAGFWSAPRGTDTADGTPRRPIELPRATDDDSAVKENEPQRLEGVVRGDDLTADEAAVAIEKGRAKTMASLWQNRQEEPKPRQPFKLEMDVESNAGVYENAPTALDGVVRSTDQVDTAFNRIFAIGTFSNLAAHVNRFTDADGSHGGRVFTSVCLSVCFFRTISQKPMQLGSPNLTHKCSTMSPRNQFILESKG